MEIRMIAWFLRAAHLGSHLEHFQAVLRQTQHGGDLLDAYPLRARPLLAFNAPLLVLTDLGVCP